MQDYSRKATLPEKFFDDQWVIVAQTGAGGSTLCEYLHAEYPELTFVSGSKIMSDYRETTGMSKVEFAEHLLKHPELDMDARCDKILREEGRKNHRIIETRIPGNAPFGFTIFPTCSATTRAMRRQQEKEYQHLTTPEIMVLNEKRDFDDKGRYDIQYPGWEWSINDYRRWGQIIYSDHCSKQEVLALAIEGQRKWKERMRAIDRLTSADSIPVRI